ncbi:RNA-directed DNA polymerase, eukaryota [Tanacetum coccineum]
MYDLQKSRYLFSMEGKRIPMIPLEERPKLSKPEVTVEEKMLKVEVVEKHVEKIQDIQICDKHVNEISTLVLKTAKEVGVLKTCDEEVSGSKIDEDVKGFHCEQKTDFECIYDVKRKSTQDKVRREKIFEVNEALDSENSRASSFQVRENDGIRLWVNDKKIQSACSKNSIVSELRDIDKRLDQYGPIDSLIFRRQDLMSNLNDLKEMEDMDFVQKAKVRWAIEGDENSKYFHGIINKKRSNLAIRGVFVDGTWCTDPILVKKAFKDHYEARFNKPTKARLKLSFSFPNRLSTDQVADLERHVSHDEIRLAVWDCGVNKSPGPDGFTFEFFRKFWKVIGPDFCEAVEHFFKQGSFSKGCNSSFIALIPKVLDAKFVNDYRPISLIGCIYKVVTKILASRLAMVIAGLVSNTQSAFVAGRQILDGPFILNEVLDWCKRKKKKALFFKVDFAKAYDSVRWDFLLDVLEAFGFGSTWCTWIRGISDFAKASLLVNGSPSDEFHIHRGLKQGDPLSPFLFILVMEALHLSVCKAVDEDVFKGIQLQGSLALSHLFYADDAFFMGEWSDNNLRDDSLWFRVIQAVHGDKIDSHSVRKVSIWSSILKEVQVLKSSGFDFLSYCSKRIGDGQSTSFWKETWIGDIPLCELCSRLFALDSAPNICFLWSG